MIKKTTPKISDFGSQDAPKMGPKWNQNGAQIDKKAILKQEAKQANEKDKKAIMLEALVLQKCINRKGETLLFIFSPVS